tara:strand:- start:406 stop:900 length:495 start_codon:yes stop_codon:yes gene_type:complete
MASVITEKFKMKITKEQLKQIIKEELNMVLQEDDEWITEHNVKMSDGPQGGIKVNDNSGEEIVNIGRSALPILTQYTVDDGWYVEYANGDDNYGNAVDHISDKLWELMESSGVQLPEDFNLDTENLAYNLAEEWVKNFADKEDDDFEYSGVDQQGGYPGMGERF